MRRFIRSLISGKASGNSGLSVSLRDIEAARSRIREYISPTPLTYSIGLSELLKREVYFKWENKLRTGSFKERGALNFLLCMDEQAKSRGVCAASAGNHALALSYYANRLGIPCCIVMPVQAPLVKVESTRKTGAEVIQYGTVLTETIEKAEEISEERGYTLVPPYNHQHVIAGQGTSALEAIAQLDSFDAVVVSVGGGGLASGISIALKECKSKMYILGACSEWAEAARNNPVKHGVLPSTTIADGIAVKTIGSLTGPILEKYVDEIVSVNEQSIARAVINFLEHEKTVVEGAGAAALAAVLDNKLPADKKRVLIWVSGSNIDMNMLSRLIERDMGEKGRLMRLTASLPDRPGSLNILSGTIASAGANILQVMHDRSYTKIPGDVDITLLLEVRNNEHKKQVISALEEVGIKGWEGSS